MKDLYTSIMEALENDPEVQKIENDILKNLKKQGDLKSFVKTMNELLDQCSREDNAALWYAAIKDLFDGKYDKGHKYSAKYMNISVQDLYPTQSEIDIVNSAKWTTMKFINWNTVENIFTLKDYGATFGCPVLVYDDGKKWIIDGHHRWGQVGLLNPNGSLHCLVIKGDATVQDFLKITQGAIAAVIADPETQNNGEGGRLPVGDAEPENNIFGSALKGDKIRERIIEMMKSNKTDEELPKRVNKFEPNVRDAEDVAWLVQYCRDGFVSNGQKPRPWAAPRPVMPQTDTASPRGFKAPGAEDEGGALYALSAPSRRRMPSLKK